MPDCCVAANCSGYVNDLIERVRGLYMPGNMEDDEQGELIIDEPQHDIRP